MVVDVACIACSSLESWAELCWSLLQRDSEIAQEKLLEDDEEKLKTRSLRICGAEAVTLTFHCHQ